MRDKLPTLKGTIYQHFKWSHRFYLGQVACIDCFMAETTYLAKPLDLDLFPLGIAAE